MTDNQNPARQPKMQGDGEAAIIECLAAGQNFVFDPATNFLHADDGTFEGIRYLTEHGDMSHTPWPASEWAIDRIAKLEAALNPFAAAPYTGPNSFNRAALSDDDFRRARAALTTEGQP